MGSELRHGGGLRRTARTTLAVIAAVALASLALPGVAMAEGESSLALPGLPPAEGESSLALPGEAMAEGERSLVLPGLPPAEGETSSLRHYDVMELERLVRGEGYGSVERDENRVLFKADGSQYVLFLYDDGDLQLYYGITGVQVTTEDINQWNMRRRLSRAYIDGEADPVLEADLLANAGMNDRIISEFIKVFVGSASDFRAFLRDHDRGDTAGPTPAALGRDI